MIELPVKHKEETETQALAKDIKNNLTVIKDDIVESSKENVINGQELDDFIYHHFLNRLDPVEYCENILRHHLPKSRQKLHENQTALIRAVCNPKLKQVAGMMSRQCLLRGTIIHTCDGKLIPIEEYKDSWETNTSAPIFEIHVKGGHIIKCTANHPIRTQNGWKRADELTTNDYVLCLDYWNKFNDKYTLQYLNENIKEIIIDNHYAKIKNILNTQIQYIREVLNKLGVHGKISQDEIEIDLTYRNNLLNFKKIFPNIEIKNNFVQTDLDTPTGYGIDEEHLYYSPFISRKEIGVGEVWDVEFPNKGWFVAGGMVVHNSGKCFQKGTKILMADGSKKNVEDIQVNDKVMSPTSEPRIVTSLGHGTEQMYEIIPDDKGYNSFTVNASHILSLIGWNGNIFNIEVKDYLKLSPKEKIILLGYRAAVDYPYQPLDFNVYNLGKILSNHETNIFDENIKDYITKYTDKDILQSIKINSFGTRLQFIAGFIDGNSASIRKNKVVLKINDKSFAHEIQDMIRSVGMQSCIKRLKENYYIYFSGKFSLLKSIKTKDLKDDNEAMIFTFKVKEKKVDEYFGFTIDSPDHLFLLGDYTVTHNTESISSFCGFLIDNYPQMRVGVFTPRLQQAEVSIGRLSTFFQMNEDRLNNKIVKLTKDRIELSNKSYVTAVSASDQSNIEGLTFDVIVLDEAQKVSDYTFSERIVPMGGGCVIGSSKIQLLDGTTKTIEELVEEQNVDKIPCINIETCKLIEGKITQFCDTGIQDTIKITLSNGQEICGTYDHPVLGYNSKERKIKWYRLDEITTNINACVPKEINIFGNVEEQKAKILGLLIGDGNYSTRNVYYATKDSELEQCIINCFGKNNVCIERSHITKNKEIFKFMRIRGNEIHTLIGKYEMRGEKGSQKQLPKNYEKFNKKSLSQLISGLYDTDGTFVIEQNRRGVIGYSTISETLAHQLIHCLMKFGIHAKLYKKYSKTHIYNNRMIKGGQIFDVSIKGKENILKFNLAFYDYLLVKYKKDTLKKMSIILKNRREKIAKKYFNTDLRFEKVINVEYTGKQHVYDLTVDEYHNFIANDIFVHNTNAKIVQIGTPKTRNHFYDAVEGKAHEKWTVVKRDWTQCAQLWSLDAIYLPDPKTGIVRPYSRFVLEQAMPKVLKQDMFPNNPEIWTEGNLSVEDFRTQYMLEFIDGAGKYIDSEQVKRMTDGEFDWLDHGIIGETYVAGIDFAGSNPDGDSTQISVLRICRDGTKHKVFAKEFQDTSYPQQMYYISNLFGGYHPRFECKKIFADYTGCGAAVVQTLKEEFGIKNLEGIIFNARDRFTGSGMNMKNIMYAKWRQELDNNKFKYMTKERFEKSTAEGAGVDNLAYYHRMISEWADLEQTVTGYSVNKKIEAPVGYHDDVCDSDVLANFAAGDGQRNHMPRPTAGRFMWH